MDEKQLIAARQAAERAVADMPEGDLKVKAFEVILGRLLAVPNEQRATPPSSRKRTEARTGQDSSLHQSQAVPTSTPARILALKREGFFSEERGISEIRDELQTHGWRYELTALSGALMNLVRSRELRRAKVIASGKSSYKYFNP